ncbi:MAG: hypothetical protein KDD41_05025 [Flavobacteriales bacterium]|nr:hypothetical protein [Flavobacteriales bacterium]
MKYRCLTIEELKELETEFKHFLISNNVYTEEWEELNRKGDERVQHLVELFSDIVLDKALKNIKYLEHITSKDIKAFRCDPNEMVLIGISTANDSIDFMKDVLTDIQADLNIFRTTKAYFKEREQEVFELLQSGCSIIDEERFKKLELAYTYSTKTMQN